MDLGQNRFAVAAAWQSLVPTHRTAFLRGPIATSWKRCLLQRFHVAKELPMTVLRQRMTEDMQVRNLSPHTQASYLQQVSLFARHFGKSPDYQIYLTNEKKLA